jgi:chromosome segregation ATPase
VPVAIDWLETLEEKVREAAERITDLREENLILTAKVREMESRIAAISGANGAVEAMATELAGEHLEGERLRGLVRDLEARLQAAEERHESWTRERDEVRGRVERLVEHLEGLLQE